MEFEIDQARFVSALAIAQTVADRRSTMPVLANVLLRATSDGHVLCSATDQILAVTEKIPAQVHKTGALTLAVKHLYGLVRALASGPIRIRALENHWAEILAGDNDFKLMGMPDNDFPELPAVKGVQLAKVPGQALRDIFLRTQFSTSTDEARPSLNGVLFECDGTQAVAVSTDGHRLTRYAMPLSGPKLGTEGVIVPRKGISELLRVLERGESEVGFGVAHEHLFVQTGDLLLSVKLNGVPFPPYRQVIPAKHDRRVRLGRNALLDALRRAEVLAPEKTSTVRIELSDGKLELTADNPDLGVAHQRLAVEYEGKPLIAGFNARYLIDLLEVVDAATVQLEFQGELDPCVVRPVDGPDLLGVVMPMRI